MSKQIIQCSGCAGKLSATPTGVASGREIAEKLRSAKQSMFDLREAYRAASRDTTSWTHAG